MNPRLAQVLVAVGVLGAGAVVWTVRDGVTREELIDAGLADCQRADVTCPIRRILDGGTQYRTVTVGARWCGPDAGLVLPSLPGNAEYFRPDLCRRALPTIAEGTELDVQDECACSSGAGCTVPNPDGGALPIPAPPRETLGPGYRFATFAGAGCIRKPCGEIIGQSSWPAACGAQ